MRLIFASNNAHKLEEMRAIMPSGMEMLSLKEVGFHDEIAETGTTLEENSRIKAETVLHWLMQAHANHALETSAFGVFADDTGLEIAALHGQPGVYTARWYAMGTDALAPLQHEQEVFAANRCKALRLLAPEENRSARFRTVITLMTCIYPGNGQAPTIKEYQMDGSVEGCIATAEHGEGGFGYDPIFIPEGYDKTFAELPPETKNTISHRAKAMEKLAALLQRGL